MQAHFKTGIIARYVVGNQVFEASTSTDPFRPIQVATYTHPQGFIDPRSLATFRTAEDARAEVERRAAAAITPRIVVGSIVKGAQP